MQDTVAQQIHKAAQALLSQAGASGQGLAVALNSMLNQFLGWPYRASAASITDSDGVNTKTFESIIYTVSSQASQQPDSVNVKAETIASILYPLYTLTPESLRQAYDDIRIVKQLKKARIPNPIAGQIETPLGIVFAIDTSEPMENLAEHMMLLNKSYPSSEWPDMVVILKKGTINYAVQFEGDPTGCAVQDLAPPCAAGCRAAQRSDTTKSCAVPMALGFIKTAYPEVTSLSSIVLPSSPGLRVPLCCFCALQETVFLRMSHIETT